MLKLGRRVSFLIIYYCVCLLILAVLCLGIIIDEIKNGDFSKSLFCIWANRSDFFLILIYDIKSFKMEIQDKDFLRVTEGEIYEIFQTTLV